jgi:hypothetical protein
MYIQDALKPLVSIEYEAGLVQGAVWIPWRNKEFFVSIECGTKITQFLISSFGRVLNIEWNLMGCSPAFGV